MTSSRHSTQVAARWIEFPTRRTQPRLRLFCFHGAGGGAHQFRTWHQHLPHDIDIYPVQLPGRTSRAAEAPYRSIDALIPDLRAALSEHLDVPFVLLGHSMGALVAFHLARELRRRGETQPKSLVVLSRSAPRPHEAKRMLHTLLDDALLEALDSWHGSIPKELRREPALLALLLPLLRADLELNETYELRSEPPLAIPIIAFGGISDLSVPHESVAHWAAHTSAGFSLRMVPGGHYFFETSRTEFARQLSLELEA